MSKSTSAKFKSDDSSVMEGLLSKYSKNFKSFNKGEKISGTVLEISPNRVIVDIGGKSEGLVAEKAFKEAEEYIKSLKVGDTVDAAVIIPETRDGFTILSFRKAKFDTLWEILLRSRDDGLPLTVEGKNVTNSGIMVEVKGLSGFIPNSQLGKDALENAENLIGKKFQAVVIDVDREDNKVILSEKEVSEKDELALARRAIEETEEGETFEGQVASIYDFGVFVKIEKKTKEGEMVPLEGLVHISELSWEKTRRSDDAVSIGETVKVKVIGKTKGKLALSIKQATANPWDTIAEKYPKDKRVTGEITRHSDFGVFVALEPGVEGLVHITKIPPATSYERGDKVDVYIEEVDAENKKISLGLILTSKPVGYK
ncbi:MAG: 30S ribosomal protein S1 [Candidatus Woesebacteria bacterium GW2011_GWA1_37_8]|uniref:30S ribosomal protein S1 n=2 Tax=Candidatus Woeseibacteriota TaxID=1752722 RepID=A0A0G0HM29_9BACT|nr:MAG: 30S ribosomal protein S1 [Candidatus Woesebacteria bacterium GW2011_GWA1_37_8]